MSLLPKRHPEHDFFIPAIFDNIPIKSDIATMEHPMFTLSKKRDMRCLEYRKDAISLTVAPSIYGLPTIFDKDVLLYCSSLLMEEINKGCVPPRTLRVSSHDLLVATNRQTSGEGYLLLKKALDRLQGVSIKTNIKTNDYEITKGFGVIDGYGVVESTRVKKRMIRLEITLSKWFYNSLLGKEVLTISPDYFRLGKALERRLYELARKYCGRQHEWKISLEHLLKKSGSAANINMFRFSISSIVEDNHLPDYDISFSRAKDMVTFRPTKALFQEQEICLDVPALDVKTVEKARALTEEAGTGWDFEALREQFTVSLMEGFKPDSVNGAFINFVKKKVSHAP